MPLVSSLAAEDVSLTSGGRAGFLSGGLVIFIFAHMLVLGKAHLPIRREGKVFFFLPSSSLGRLTCNLSGGERIREGQKVRSARKEGRPRGEVKLG